MQAMTRLIAYAAAGFVISTRLVVAQGGGEVRCSSLIRLPCAEHATFMVAFDRGREVAEVSLAPGGVEYDGAKDAARCYATHWRQIPVLEKALERERAGKGTAPTNFTFDLITHCEDETFFHADEP
jgi:hypothetical protein